MPRISVSRGDAKAACKETNAKKHSSREFALNIRYEVSIFLSLICFCQSEYKHTVIVANEDMPQNASTFEPRGSIEVLVGLEKGNIDMEDASIIDAAIDRDGHLFYITYSRIYKLEADARVLIKRKFAMGQGPGDFQHEPSYVCCDPNGNVYVYDGYKIIVFDNDLNFQRNVQIRMLPGYDFIVDKDGNIYSIKIGDLSSGAKIALAVFNKMGATVREIATDIQSRSLNIGGISLFSEHAYSIKAYYCLDREGNLFIAENDRYQIMKYGTPGKVSAVISVMEKPHKIDSEEMKLLKGRRANIKVQGVEFHDEVSIPSYRPYIKKMLCDENGMLYVVKMKSIRDETQGEMIDIFDRAGAFKYRWKTSFVPFAIKKGFFYYIVHEENESVRLERIRFG